MRGDTAFHRVIDLVRPYLVERGEGVELPGRMRRDHRQRLQPRQADRHILDQCRGQVLGNACLLEILQRRQQHNARHKTHPGPVFVRHRSATFYAVWLSGDCRVVLTCKQVGGFGRRFHAEAVPQPIAERGKGGAGTALVVLGAEQLDGGATHHIGVGQALGQAEQRRMGAATADAQRGFRRLGGELILDAGALERQPLVELAAHAADAGQQFAAIETDQPFELGCILGAADTSDLAQIEHHIAVELDLGGVGVEQVKPVLGLEFTRMQQGLPEVGHRLLGGAAFPGSLRQSRPPRPVGKVQIQHSCKGIGLLAQLYCRTIRQAEDRGPQKLQGDRFTHRSDRHCSVDPTKVVEVYLTK